MLVALALVDLPFKAAEHKTEFKGTQMTLTAGSPMIVYHEEIQPAAKVAEHTPILVSENFFRSGDQFRQENGEQVDKFVTEEFLIDTVYGCQIVVTNPTSSKKKVEVLLQIPTGALAGRRRAIHAQHPPRSRSVPHADARIPLLFPGPGKFAHYPVQVAGNGGGSGEVLAFAAPFTFNVVKQLTKIDKQSWDYISQYGSEDDVLNFLKTENILAGESRPHRLADARQGLLRQSDRAVGRPARLQQHALVVRREARRRADHPAVLAIREPVRPAMRRLARQPAADDRSEWPGTPTSRWTTGRWSTPASANLAASARFLNDRFFAQYQRLLTILSYRRAAG